MKKLFFTLLTGIGLIAGTSTANAQAYKTAAGLAIDFGDGGTLVGPHLKHFFTSNGALEGGVLFGSGETLIQGLYTYNAAIKGASGLMWNIGVGPGVSLYKGGSTFAVRPNLGLDYKIGGAPIALAADWRPTWAFYDGGNNFNAARFQLGFKYVFK